MKEELTQKIRHNQRMVAKIYELRCNPKVHFQLEHDPSINIYSDINDVNIDSMHNNKISRNQNPQALNSNIQHQSIHDMNWKGNNIIQNNQYWIHNEDENNLYPILQGPLENHQYVDDLDFEKKNVAFEQQLCGPQNIQYWVYDKDKNALYPILQSLANHQHLKDLGIENEIIAFTPQLYVVHPFVSNQEDMYNKTHFENNESSSIKTMKEQSFNAYQFVSNQEGVQNKTHLEDGEIFSKKIAKSFTNQSYDVHSFFLNQKDMHDKPHLGDNKSSITETIEGSSKQSCNAHPFVSNQKEILNKSHLRDDESSSIRTIEASTKQSYNAHNYMSNQKDIYNKSHLVDNEIFSITSTKPSMQQSYDAPQFVSNQEDMNDKSHLANDKTSSIKSTRASMQQSYNAPQVVSNQKDMYEEIYLENGESVLIKIPRAPIEQSYSTQQFASNQINIYDRSHLENGENLSFKTIEGSTILHYNLPTQTNEKHGMHDSFYVLPCHYIEGLVKNDSIMESKKYETNMCLYAEPKKIDVEKKIILDTKFKKNKFLTKPSSSTQNLKCCRTNWSLNLPILDNETFFNDQYSSCMTKKSSQNEKDDNLSINLNKFDEKSSINNVSNNMNEAPQYISSYDESLKQYSIIHQNNKHRNNDKILHNNHQYTSLAIPKSLENEKNDESFIISKISYEKPMINNVTNNIDDLPKYISSYDESLKDHYLIQQNNKSIDDNQNSLHNDDKYSSLAIEKSLQNEKNDELSRKSKISNENPLSNNIINNIDETPKHISTYDEFLRHHSVSQQNDINMNDALTHHEVHHDIKSKKNSEIYNKTPKFSYFQLISSNKQYTNKELDYNFFKNDYKSKSYVPSNFNNDDDYSHNIRWSSPFELAFHDDNPYEIFDLKTKTLSTSNLQPINIYTNLSKLEIESTKKALENKIPIDEPRTSYVRWNDNLSLDEIQLPKHLTMPIADSSNENNFLHEFVNSIENSSSDNASSIEYDSISSTLHPFKEQHSFYEYINLNDNLINEIFLQESMHSSIPKSLELVKSTSEESLTIKNKTNDNSIIDTFENSNETLFVSNLKSLSQDPLNLFSPHDMSKDAIEDSSVAKNSTHVSSMYQSFQDTILSKELNEIKNKNTKVAFYENKINLESMKSPSFVQSNMSILQSESNKTQQSHTNENKIVTKSDMKENNFFTKNNEVTNQKDNENQVIRQSQSKSKYQLSINNIEDVLNKSTSFDSYSSESRFAQSSIIQNNDEKNNKSKNFVEDTIQNQNVVDLGFEDKIIDDLQYHDKQPYHKMNASQKTSFDQVKEGLFLKFENQQVKESKSIPSSSNFINSMLDKQQNHRMVQSFNNQSIDTKKLNDVIENESTSYISPSRIDHGRRQYSRDKFDLNKLKDFQQRSKSTSTSRISVYSSFEERPSKSKINLNEAFRNNHQNNTSKHEDNTIESINEKNLDDLEAKAIDDFRIHSKQTSIYKNQDITNALSKKIEESFMLPNNEVAMTSSNDDQSNSKANEDPKKEINEDITNAISKKIENSFMLPKNEVAMTSSDNDQSNSKVNEDPKKNVLCVARIRFVIPKRSTTLQNNVATSTSLHNDTLNV